MSISLFWLEMGADGVSPSTSPANHQKLNVIQKQAFHFLAGEGWQWGLSPLTSLSNHQKLNKSKNGAFHFFGWRVQMGFESINQPGQSSEVEHNFKMSISYFWLERGGRRDLSTSTSLADHQKLNIIQK